MGLSWRYYKITVDGDRIEPRIVIRDYDRIADEICRQERRVRGEEEGAGEPEGR